MRVGRDAERVRPVTIFHESAGAVVMIGDRCLVLRRGRQWVFPKGHLERGERPEDTAIREVREEAGVEIRILQPIGSTRYGFGKPADAVHRKRVYWFLAESDANAFRLEPTFSEAAVLEPGRGRPGPDPRSRPRVGGACLRRCRDPAHR